MCQHSGRQPGLGRDCEEGHVLGQEAGKYGPTLRKFQTPLGAWPLSLGCREPWKDLEQERKCQT